MSTIKLVTLGIGAAGKSCSVIRFVQGAFVGDKYSPTIEDSYRKSIEVKKGHFAMLEVLDTAGTEQFLALRDLYYRNGDGFVLVFDLTDAHSFNELESIPYLSLIHI
eukprot:TRINITY_DN8054_c0_g1_i1.p1 TRINITY_DN8054_c0_g1~~TRINITY_DN8054_c0_g1_i1.p1  ORF type:complete len:115 (+),score=27.52 TRINITY_DN8054_c0_g1_i1:27-347(+)